MRRRPVPQYLFRAHANTEGPMDASSSTGTWRFDDFRTPAQFHVLYTGDSVEGCFIEKLQRFRGSDNEAREILASIDGDDSLPPVNTIPAQLLRNLAASSLRVIDVAQDIIQIDALESIMELRELGAKIRIDLPDLKPADVLQSNYDYSRRLSVIVFETQPTSIGSASRSSLDSPSDTSTVHTNFNLFRETPERGSEIRLRLERLETGRALDRYRPELEAAIAFLQATPALPLDHPDLAAI